MSTSKLMKVTYYDPKSQIRLLCYADTVVWDTKPTPTLTALRFGGYPERVQGLADAIYGGATIEIEDGRGGQPKVHAHADRYQLRNRDPRLHGRLCGTVRKRCHQRRLIPRGHTPTEAQWGK